MDYLRDDPAQGRLAEKVLSSGDGFVPKFDDRRYVRRATKLDLKPPVRLVKGMQRTPE